MILKFLGLIYLGLLIYCNYFFIREVNKQSISQGRDNIDRLRFFINVLFLPVIICVRACKGDE